MSSRRFVVRAVEEKKAQIQATDPDLSLFLWGMLAGGILTVVVEGVVLYFTWPFLVGALKTWVGAEALREVLG